jgi:hypothetical protein
MAAAGGRPQVTPQATAVSQPWAPASEHRWYLRQPRPPRAARHTVHAGQEPRERSSDPIVTCPRLRGSDMATPLYRRARHTHSAANSRAAPFPLPCPDQPSPPRQSRVAAAGSRVVAGAGSNAADAGYARGMRRRCGGVRSCSEGAGGCDPDRSRRQPRPWCRDLAGARQGCRPAHVWLIAQHSRYAG